MLDITCDINVILFDQISESLLRHMQEQGHFWGGFSFCFVHSGGSSNSVFDWRRRARASSWLEYVPHSVQSICRSAYFFVSPVLAENSFKTQVSFVVSHYLWLVPLSHHPKLTGQQFVLWRKKNNGINQRQVFIYAAWIVHTIYYMK